MIDKQKAITALKAYQAGCKGTVSDTVAACVGIIREVPEEEMDGRLVQYVPGNIVYDRFGMEWTVKSAEIHQIGGTLRHLYRCGHPGTNDYRALYADEILTREEAEAVLEGGAV